MGQRLGIAALILAVSALLSRILGFLREAVIAYLHGASGATDAYYAAFTLPDLMIYFLAGGTLSITFIPLFSAYVARGDEAGGWRLFSNIATTMGGLLVLAVIVFELLTPYLIPVLFPGFDDPEHIALAVQMTRIVIPAQLAFYLGGLISATLFVREVFWPSAVAPLVYNLCIILGGVLLEPWFGIQGFAIGVLVGAFLGPLGLPLFAARNEIRYSPVVAVRDPGFKKFIWLTLPLMLGVSLVTVDEWLLRYFGSETEGAITWLNNGRKLMLVSFAIIGQAAGQAALPFLTRLFHEKKIDEMGEMLAASLQRVCFLACIAAGGLLAVATPLVYAIFRRGQFTAHDADMTAQLLVFFAIGLPAWATQTMAVRGFYARQDTFTPMVIGTVVVVVSAPLYWLLHGALDIKGLALASTLGMTLNAIATVVVYRWRKGALPLIPIGLGLLRGSAIGALAGGAGWWIARLTLEHFGLGSLFESAVAFAASAGTFAAVVVIAGALMQPPELEFVFRKIRSKLSR